MVISDTMSMPDYLTDEAIDSIALDILGQEVGGNPPLGQVMDARRQGRQVFFSILINRSPDAEEFRAAVLQSLRLRISLDEAFANGQGVPRGR